MNHKSNTYKNLKIVLDEQQEGNGVFSFLLPTLASLLPSLLSKGGSIKKTFFLK